MAILVLIGRVLFGGAVILLGLNNFLRFEEKVSHLRSKGIPFARLGVALGTALVMLGGLSILLGYQVKYGVALVVAFLVTVTPIIHNFWAGGEPEARQGHMIHFLKNLALIGAALLFLAISRPWDFALGQ